MSSVQDAPEQAKFKSNATLQVFISDDEAVAHNVLGRLEDVRIKPVLHDDPVAGLYGVHAHCTPRQMAVAIRRGRVGARYNECFGCGGFRDSHGKWSRRPQSAAGWYHQFSHYLAQRWFDNDTTLPALHPGPNSGDPGMVPLVLRCRLGHEFDLSDPLTAVLWMEYLLAVPYRLVLWQRFERKHGPQMVLPGFRSAKPVAVLN